jgi:hypothetical protein
MSTRTFLILASVTIVLLITFLLLDKYQECRATRPFQECPSIGPYVSRSGGFFGRLPPPAKSE